MGVRAGLSLITSQDFEQIALGFGPVLGSISHHSIDKAWNDFHQTFRSKGPPLSLAIAGDCRSPHIDYSLDEFCRGIYEYYIGFVSPGLVVEVAALLREVDANDYKQWESEQFGDQYNCGETFFPRLRAAYLEAANRNCGLMVVIG